MAAYEQSLDFQKIQDILSVSLEADNTLHDLHKDDEVINFFSDLCVAGSVKEMEERGNWNTVPLEHLITILEQGISMFETMDQWLSKDTILSCKKMDDLKSCLQKGRVQKRRLL